MSRPGPSPVKVLLVDDHPLVRVGLRLLLAEAGEAEVVGEAADGETAVLMAAALRPDVVLMDCMLPELSGAEATKLLLATHPGIKVLGFSALADAATASALLEAGAAGYALKGSSPRELALAVRTVADGGSYLAPTVAGALNAKQRRQAMHDARLASLSPREAEVLRLFAQGQTLKKMAVTLGISPRTLETYKSRAMCKLDLSSRAELMRFALHCGWLAGDVDVGSKSGERFPRDRT